MHNDTDGLRAMFALNEYIVKATLDYWTTISYPALLLAKCL